MSHRDEYYNRAKQEGYRARSAYKLKQIDERANVLSSGDTVVDLGAAPGGWLQVAAETVGPSGTVLGVDRQAIDDLDGVETLRGDITTEETREQIQNRVGSAEVVLSDMAPEMSGEYELDHARSVHLARQALETAVTILESGGDFVVKVFQGRDLDDFRNDIASEFASLQTVTPAASRDSSSEVYLVAKGRLTAPVRAGDELTVTVSDVGRDGDGVAHVEGFTVFVPDTEPGEEVAVEITDVKPRFAFAQRR